MWKTRQLRALGHRVDRLGGRAENERDFSDRQKRRPCFLKWRWGNRRAERTALRFLARLRLALDPTLLLDLANGSHLHAEPIRKGGAVGFAGLPRTRTCGMGRETSLCGGERSPRWSLINDQGWAANVDHLARWLRRSVASRV
jgi:hypothetical protein